MYYLNLFWTSVCYSTYAHLIYDLALYYIIKILVCTMIRLGRSRISMPASKEGVEQMWLMKTGSFLVIMSPFRIQVSLDHTLLSFH